jgi:DNA-binding LacI/PurR family transcriptional regulator
MKFKISSPADQVTSYLREEIRSGRWKGEMPGVSHLQNRLGVNHVAINAALRQLEREGLLVSQGRRRCRLISANSQNLKARKLRIRVMPYDKESRIAPDYLGIIDGLHQQGFSAGFSRKGIHELGMDKGRVARFVKKNQADAWVVSGASQEIFQWFAEQEVPAIALFGRFTNVSIAGVGVRKSPIMEKLVRRLAALGHRRIVSLVHRERIVPKLALYEQNFQKVMTDCGITTGSFNLPEWEPSRAGLFDCLDTLFKHTPPTALILDEPRHFIAAQNYLITRGIRVPHDVSLICGDSDPSFSWSSPQIIHMKWEPEKLINHVVRWTNQVAVGKVSRRQKFYDAELVEGGTIAPPP